MTDHDLGPVSATGPPPVGGDLEEAAERYASLFTHHPHAAYSVDPRGYYTDANPLALAMTGLTLEEMRNTHFLQVIHPDDRRLMEEGFERVLGGEPQLLEARVVRSDGEVVDIRCTAIPVVVDGEVVGVHGITEDVTESNRVLQELEDANTAKMLFLATVSHEVRTPLAALVGATELLMETDLDPEPEHYARIVHRSSDRLMRLAEDILEFSGLEAQQAVLRPRPFVVRAVLEDIAAWAAPLAEARGLETSFVVDEDVPVTAVGDCRRISQVVTNLVDNALKFTERGGVEVHVSALAVEDDRTWIDVTVRDTGIGIAHDHMRTLFHPFTQAEPHVSGDRQGSGLGLAISQEIATLMEGRLSVASVPGEGSTFTFRVPLANPGAAAS